MNPVVCDDGSLQFGEECDGDQLGGATCADAGMFDGGTLACDAMTCTFDTSGCSSCGDGVVEGDEVCEAADLGGETCVSQGFPDGGTLACDAGCGGYDTALCTGPECGDSILEAPERCDSNELSLMNCEDLGFAGGSLDCTPLTCGFDTSECSDGVIALCSGDLGTIIDGSATITETLSLMDMGTVGDVDVFVDITHAWGGDLEIQLRHVASDTTVDLVFDDCDPIGEDDVWAFFNDEGNDRRTASSRLVSRAT